MGQPDNRDLIQSPAIRAAVNGQKECAEMARRRYQHGSLKIVGKRVKQWQARFREDVILPDGSRSRVEKKEILGTKREIPTLREAQRRLDDRLSTINDRHYRPRVVTTFREFAQQWEKSVLSVKKDSYQASEKSRIRTHLIPVFGDKLVGELSCFDVQQFVATVNVGAKTKRNLIATLRSMYRSAKFWNLTQQDWFAGVVLPTWEHMDARHFTADEAKRIIEAAPDPLKSWVWLLAETGIRLGEVCALRPQDLHLDQQIVIIRHSAWRSTHFGTTKSKRARVFRLSTRLTEHLREFTKGKSPDEFIFQRKDGTAWQGDHVVRDRLKPLLKSLGIESAGAHAFRHMNASLMDQMRIPDKVRQDRLGHVDFSAVTIGVYTHADSQDHLSVAERLGEMLAPSVTASGMVN